MIGKIEGPGSVRTSPSVKRSAKKSGDGSFASHLDETNESGSTGASASASGAGLVSGLWGLQEVDDATARASKGKLRAENILDELEELRLDLLAGLLSRKKLERLLRLVNSRRAMVSDPRLGALLDEIDLRAQVELAKYSPADLVAG